MGRLSNIVDTVVGAISPERQALRGHFRRMENDPDYRDMILAMMNARGYRAASTTGGGAPWLGGDRTADAEILGDLPTLINRSRELNRDDPIASGLTQTFVNNIVGRGIVPQAKTGKAARDKALEAVWRERSDLLAPADGLSQAELQRLLVTKAIEDGNSFIKATKTSRRDPIWFETIEKDRIATPQDAKPSAGGRIVDGVEKDANGIPIAYWVAKQVSPNGSLSFEKKDFDRVDASVMRHLRRVDRPGQTHGVPWLHAVLQDLRDLDLLLIASLKRAQISACLALFIKSSKGAAGIFDVTAKKYGYQLDQAIEPGMIFKLYPEEEVQTLVPNFPTPELEPFIIMLCRRIGAALGVSWQIVLKDFSKANYSSARTDLNEAHQVYRLFQRWLIEKVLNWEWEMVMVDAVLRNDPRLKRARVTIDDIRMVRWITPGWAYVDPLKEAKAHEVYFAMGALTLQEICAARGADWEEVQTQKLTEEKREEDERERLGLGPKEPVDEPKPAEEPPPVDDQEEDEEEETEERSAHATRTAA